ncbi:MAG: citramalate synthase [Firmicutes bacterium]|uniref:Citramalate synthase n=1 Tax=Sulfobacillus benefaciens TaxID=453960 RepID=A0A2T2XBH4_9FIRM|nr:citramalate synthase [Bacillota bacterium]MCL5012440.1 citramalate synthase [Bacillota bacterium]PSR31820.1 MAG: citramalate synthase [Sulfobacillus benefaciens]
MSTPVQLYDTTLRDGTQRRGISLSVEDKLQIAQLLDEFGFDYIEGGWPASNPKDTAFFQAVGARVKHAKITAFGSTRRRGVTVDADASLRAILDARCPAATLFGKSSVFQATKILGLTPDENLTLIEESIRYLINHGLEVIFDAEHFFDGCKEDLTYALKVLTAAQNGGANWIVLCDTNGGNLPDQIEGYVKQAQSVTQVPLGIHAHNDGGLAVANSLIAVRGGATMVQGTINGYGERCGNADLCTIWPNLVYKMHRSAGYDHMLPELTRLSRTVAEIANLIPDDSAPFVGDNAFAHKAGVHVGAVRKYAEAYEHIRPEQVGQTRRILVSELAGRSNLLYHFQNLDASSETVKELVQTVKRMEARGYQYEDAPSSMKLLVERSLGNVPDYFVVDRFHTSVTHDQRTIAEATVRIIVGDSHFVEVGEGDGPVHALDVALRRALTRIYPVIASLRLQDYKVRVLDGRDGTRSQVRVWILSEFRDEPVRTVGVSRNILEASWLALLDSVNYTLWTSHVIPATMSGPQAQPLS